MSSDRAEFETRTSCITCGSKELKELARGRFDEEPLHSFLANDPFGENPLPYLKDAEWQFVQCDVCQQKFHRNILNEKWNGIYYNRWITSEAIEAHAQASGHTGFHSDFRKGKHAVERILQIERLTRNIRGADAVRVLDFGCGEGRFLSTCADFGFECVGVEFSAAREKTKVINFFPDLDEVKKETSAGHFHAAVLFEVLEHLSDPLDVLRSIRPLLTDNGILILETPNCPEVTGIHDQNDYELINPLGHINAFTAQTQERIAKEAGFERVKPSTVQCTADPLRAYKRELRRLLQPFLKRYTQQYFVAV